MLAAQASLVGPAQVPGRLYDLGDFPGARPGDASIAGEIFHLDDPAATLDALDEYEGPEFERAVMLVNDLECWIYWYIGPDPGRPIPSGDWFNR